MTPLRGYVLLPGQPLAHYFDSSMTALCGHESQATSSELRKHLSTTAELVVSHLQNGTPDVFVCRTCSTMRRRELHARAAALNEGRVA